jgi:hypothetical protein
MSVTYSTATKTARMAAVITQIDGTSSAGLLKITNGTGGTGTVLATIALARPCGTASAGVLTFSGLPKSDTSADATGTAYGAIITDQDGTTCISGLTVGTSGADIIIDNQSIVTAQTVTLIATSTITHG